MRHGTTHVGTSMFVSRPAARRPADAVRHASALALCTYVSLSCTPQPTTPVQFVPRRRYSDRDQDDLRTHTSKRPRACQTQASRSAPSAARSRPRAAARPGPGPGRRLAQSSITFVASQTFGAVRTPPQALRGLACRRACSGKRTAGRGGGGSLRTVQGTRDASAALRYERGQGRATINSYIEGRAHRQGGSDCSYYSWPFPERWLASRRAPGIGLRHTLPSVRPGEW